MSSTNRNEKPKQYEKWGMQKKKEWNRRYKMSDEQVEYRFKSRDAKKQEEYEENIKPKRRDSGWDLEESRLLYNSIIDFQLWNVEKGGIKVYSTICRQLPRRVGTHVSTMLFDFRKNKFHRVHESMRDDFKELFQNPPPPPTPVLHTPQIKLEDDGSDFEPIIIPPPPQEIDDIVEPEEEDQELKRKKKKKKRRRRKRKKNRLEKEISRKKKKAERYRSKEKRGRKKIKNLEKQADSFKNKADKIEEEIRVLTGKKRKRSYDDDDDDKLINSPRKKLKR